MTRTAPVSEKELELRKRHRDDFTYYAPRCLFIRTKDGTVRRFQLNKAQLYLHSEIEDQLRRTGKVRKIIVKGRQQGCSTYVEGRFFWKTTHRRGVKTFILTHLDEATANLFGMTKRFYDHVPAVLKPSTKASNAKELAFDLLDSSYKVSTAGSKGTGRSDTLQYFHGSEVAYWPNADTHVAGALQAVADMPGTEVILESTSAGPAGLFYEYCKAAMAGQGDYEIVFIPWFWQDEYRKDATDFVPTSEEVAYAKKYAVDQEQLAWRRGKITELRGVHNFRREYPATLHEAFTAERPGALWKRELIDETRVQPKEVPPLKRIVVGIDPSGGDDPSNDEVGIVCGGLGYNGHVYILRDDSGHYGPNAWGLKAVALYKKLKADRIIGEKNYGGDMVEHVVRTVDPKVSYRGVTATRGKTVRAEPVAALMEQGKVHHVGTFIAMEDEMCTYVDDGKMKSPNRMDGMVWVVTELLLGGKSLPTAAPVAIGQNSSFPG